MRGAVFVVAFADAPSRLVANDDPETTRVTTLRLRTFDELFQRVEKREQVPQFTLADLFDQVVWHR